MRHTFRKLIRPGAEIYAEINTEAQLAAEYAVPNEIDKLYNGMGGSGLNAPPGMKKPYIK